MGERESELSDNGKALAARGIAQLIRLSLQLLDHEPRAAEQVPLLLTMKEDTVALTKAIDSGDTDLGACLLDLCACDMLVSSSSRIPSL